MNALQGRWGRELLSMLKSPARVRDRGYSGCLTTFPPMHVYRKTFHMFSFCSYSIIVCSFVDVILKNIYICIHTHVYIHTHIYIYKYE